MKAVGALVAFITSACLVFAADPVNSGQLYEWGYTNQIQGRAAAVAVLSNAIQASANETWSLALRNDGSLYAWGQNAFNQTNAPAGNNFTYSAAGWRHGIAAKTDGSVIEWGDETNSWTELAPTLTNAWKVSGGDLHSTALTSNNVAYFWGFRSSVINHADVTNCVEVVSGWYHSVCLLADGTVTMVGTAVGGNAGHYVDPPFTLTNVVKIGAGLFASYAIISNATTPRQLIAWGTSNYWGELDIPAQYATNVVFATGGHRHTLWITADGASHVVGDNTFGQTNIDANLATADLLYSGSFHSGGIKSDPVGTTYYVATTGNDTNAGTIGSPFLTVQKGVNSAYSGDRILVASGTYDETVSSARNATNGPIVINGQGVATVNGFSLNHSNIYIQNFTIKGITNVFSRLLYMDRGASYCVISNNVMDNDNAAYVYGVQWNGSGSPPFGVAASHVRFVDNVIEHTAGTTMLLMYGDFNVVERNSLLDSPQADCFNVFGRSNVFSANLCSNFPLNTNLANHSDFIQTFGNNGYGSEHILVESNIVVGVTNGGITEIALNQLSSVLVSNITDWTFRNNLFSNIGIHGSCSVPNTKYHNNTFVHCNFYNKGQVIAITSRDYATNETYSGLAGTDYPNGGEVINNVFFECGDLDGENRLITGWYSFSTNLTNIVADYNIVIKTNYSAVTTNLLHQPIGDPGGWNQFAWWENHGINGGNPSFVNEAAGNFRVPTNSIISRAGTNLTALFTTDLDGVTRPPIGGWTIGAYEANGSGLSQLHPIIFGTAAMGKSSL